MAAAKIQLSPFAIRNKIDIFSSNYFAINNHHLKDTTDYPFLREGGKTAEIIRSLNWAATPLGLLENWPSGLRSALGIVLHSPIPMLLLWGENNIIFHNDAFDNALKSDSPILCKDASALWPDVWASILPVIGKVRNSGMNLPLSSLSVGKEGKNSLRAILKTHNCSPVYGDDGNIAGVLMTGNQATGTANISELEESRAELQFAIDAAELGTWELNPFTGTFRGNARLKSWFGVKADEEVLLSDATDAMHEDDRERVIELINYAMQYESGGKYDTEYRIVNPKTNKERTVRAKGKVWFGEDKTAYMFNGTLQDVTAQAHARNKIQESEAKFRALIEQAPVGTCLFTGPDMVIELANSTMLDYWGRDNAVIGKPFLEALPEMEGQPFLDILTKIYETGEPYEDKAARADIVVGGKLKTFYFDYTYKPVFNERGEVYGIMDMAVDVTEQVIAINKLKDSEQRVRSIVDGAPFPIGVYAGREMRITIANQSIIDVWGKGNDVVGKTYFEVLPELEEQEIYPLLLSVYDTGIPYNVRNQRVDLVVDDVLQPFYFNYSFTPLRDASGTIYGVVNTAAEVTDLNIAKQKVEQSEQNFRSMILQAPVAMCIFLGPEHVLDIANERMLELLGKSWHDVLQRPLLEAMPDAENQGIANVLDEVYHTGQDLNITERRVDLERNGKQETIYINSAYQPYRDGAGNILGVLAVTVDVTAQVLARRKIEDIVQARTIELEMANSSLHRSNSELAQFAYIASHDLQEPVRKISIFAQMLDARIHDTLDTPSLNYINKIRTSADRMQALIRDVLTYSEISKESNIFNPVDLSDIAKGTITDYELLIEQKQAIVHFENLPVIEAISLQMQQLFGNMVSNALKYSRPDVSPEITIKGSVAAKAETEAAGCNGKYYKIEFIDNGIGFDQEYAERIFNIFQRLHGKTEFSGTGIGLAICKKIVQNHNGSISAASGSGKGAHFTVLLPAKQQDTD